VFESLLQQLVGGTHGIQERPNGIAFLKVAKSLYPLDGVAYLGLNIPLGPHRKGFVQCAYSDVGIKQCVTHEALAEGQLGVLALALRQPLDWSELPFTAEATTLLRLANGPAADRRLLSVPLCAPVGEQSLICVAATPQDESWEERRDTLLREFHVLGNYFHHHILRIYGHDAAKDILMSARELDCLKWVAAGKTAWEASVILGISERTVRFHLNAAREKLDCSTTTQAVAKAVSQQLI
jgi:DNA-binding CsgD family transcriptional regulator